MELIENQGFTNKTYKDKQKNEFIKIKTYDGFNHKIDYTLLNIFPFCPKVKQNTSEKLVTDWINGNTLSSQNITNEQLTKIGKILITLHNSKQKFPKENQLARRFKTYYKKISELGKKVDVVNKYYNKLNLFVKNIDLSAPCHNDLWLFNMIENQNGIYLTDWEYASMGDVHFDLAYFIESSNLTPEQEKVFFKAYGDDYEEKYLLVHKIIVNALFVLWNNSHIKNIFDDTPYNKRIEKYMKLYTEKYNQ
ncbi:licA [Metamycoplasma hyosynoviae]|uniref:phosphotransferase n=1 Tax=Metamycoplasma hyosynoviae TaxID=29559 RepID=UPI000461FF85|nr:phosphotransferase [Metamycoplasma hyosynoviae]KDE41545.1 licA [Metamycoplasma hyosynoviae]KDE42992.1 licA [Metamycoplasma hyosynoviae]KDE43375.1 licA [Metamycoplasma hyosynoviae]KDE43583.1 licA [Metamycoplasma hyosynoviae]KDE44341.1 licA [Metamycoplasma hyosynoviae]